MADIVPPSGRPARSYRYAGKSIRRGEDLLRGAGGFLADISAPEAAELFVIRSTEPHAIVQRIRTERALESPGVIAVLTAGDLALANDALPCLDMILGTLDVRQRVMATNRVRYVGQPVALVLATNRYLAEDAAPLVEIDYEPLPSITDHLAAMRPDAPLLYP
jgi:aerobic carbon-monoxide dehydrogenase large subunit